MSEYTSKTADLALVIAGPILRDTNENTATVWFVSSEACDAEFILKEQSASDYLNYKNEHHVFQVGSHCFIHIISAHKENLLKHGEFYEYDIVLNCKTGSVKMSEELTELRYRDKQTFCFLYKKQLTNVMHGSCRKPHFEGDDALPVLDDMLAARFSKCTVVHNYETNKSIPDLLLHTGDQVYVDDVCGPMLNAIGQTIDLLGLYDESFTQANISNSNELSEHPSNFYHREKLLPFCEQNEALYTSFFKGKRKPIFTSVNAKNHLIALNEMIALYLLCWSSRLWPHIDIETVPQQIEDQDAYKKELPLLSNFSFGLCKVERAFAHIPSYMMFDDHDVTDDWNLTRDWEQQVYGNPFSKRIIGNALLAYFLCQGIGNPSSTWHPLLDIASDTFTHTGIQRHDQLIDALLSFNQWHFQLNTFPVVNMLDTRTRRWRSESNAKKPSGLMDWEALCELQDQILGQEAVIMVSPAPIYGVKLIETIQRIFTAFGGALMVDAENWMAHKGTASVILNIFKHKKTPPHFIILSGDVHYSFVYDISIRAQENSPKITQFTCSGIHNEFPDGLITWFERLNRWLYSSKSPLNVFTKRRNMVIRERENSRDKRDLLNACCLGLLELDANGHEKSCKVVLANGQVITFNQ